MAEGKVVLVTGAARGIGRAIAERLVGDGWRVVGADVSPVEIAGVRGVVADVGDEAAVGALMAGIGVLEGRLDGLVSNAGRMVRKRLAALTLAEWSGVIATNLTALFLLARAGEGMLRASGGGGIVSVASTRARMSEADTESYAASKGGLVALTHALAISLGPDVRVNCVSPGWIDVVGEALSAADGAQHPVGRVGRPADVAAMVAFLLGAESAFVTGAEFVVDGGMTRKMIYAE